MLDKDDFMKNSVDNLKRVVTYSRELDRDADLPDIERIAGLYPRGYLSLYAAPAGTGKTWFMQYISCRVSCGGNILAGLVPKSKKMKTVIMAGETGKYLLDKRLQATCWAYDKKRIHVYDAVEMQRDEIPIMLNTDEGKASLITILDYEKPDLLFIDTLISFHTADESKQGEMTGLYTFLLRLAKEFNCAIVLNHHTRKRSTKNPNAKMTQDDIIGSSAAVRLCSCAYIGERIVDEVEDDEGMPTIRVKNVKTWDKRLPDFSYKFITDEATGRIDFAIDWGSNARTEEWSLRERVSSLVATFEVGAMLKADIIAAELCTSKDSARKYLDELADKRVLDRYKLMGETLWKVLEKGGSK